MSQSRLSYKLGVLSVSAAVFFSQLLSAQNAVPQSSDPGAIATIQTAIKALGGQSAWQQAGGATATVVISPTGFSSRTLKWTDDWSTGRVRFRRDKTETGATPSSMIGTDKEQILVLSNGKTVPLRQGNGIAVLALSYPAAALLLSQSPKYNCSFHNGKTENLRVPIDSDSIDKVVLTERCPDPSYPDGTATLIWTFSKTTGMPQSVETPIWGQTRFLLRTEAVSFVAYQTVDGLVVPSEVTIRRVSGSVDQLTISKTTFVQSVPDTAFQAANRP